MNFFDLKNINFYNFFSRKNNFFHIWVVSFLGAVCTRKKGYIKGSKNSLGKSNGGTTNVNIPNWSLSLEFLQKKKIFSKNHFWVIFSDSKVEKIDFFSFFENHDFSEKNMKIFDFSKNRELYLYYRPELFRWLKYRFGGLKWCICEM